MLKITNNLSKFFDETKRLFKQLSVEVPSLQPPQKDVSAQLELKIPNQPYHYKEILNAPQLPHHLIFLLSEDDKSDLWNLHEKRMLLQFHCRLQSIHFQFNKEDDSTHLVCDSQVFDYPSFQPVQNLLKSQPGRKVVYENPEMTGGIQFQTTCALQFD